MLDFTIGFVLLGDKMEKYSLDLFLLVFVNLFGCIVNNPAQLRVKQKL